MMVKARNLYRVGFTAVFLIICIGVIICFAKVLQRLLSVGSFQILTYDSLFTFDVFVRRVTYLVRAASLA
jgi:hypothetical protein